MNQGKAVHIPHETEGDIGEGQHSCQLVAPVHCLFYNKPARSAWPPSSISIGDMHCNTHEAARCTLIPCELTGAKTF
jgi:hypothetical protein